jgi:hypothetical protein
MLPSNTLENSAINPLLTKLNDNSQMQQNVNTAVTEWVNKNN